MSQWRPRPTVVCAINGRHVAEPTVGWSHRTVHCAPDSVRCTNGSEDPMVGFARKGRRSGTGQLLFMSGGAPDCPVRHPTEDKNCLPNWTPTAPSCLGAIKRTPRRMEQYTKHSLNILRLLNFVITQSVHSVRDLSTVRVVNSCTVILCSRLGFVRVFAAIWVLRVLLSLPYFCASCVINIVRVRGSNLWRFLANGKRTLKRKDRGIQVDHWITWKGLSATLVHWDATTWK
jgi:hypothetical protein